MLCGNFHFGQYQSSVLGVVLKPVSQLSSDSCDAQPVVIRLIDCFITQWLSHDLVPPSCCIYVCICSFGMSS